MKRWIPCICAALIVFGLAVFGAAYRGSYTDVASQPDYLLGLNVAEVQTPLVEASCRIARDVLPSQPFIFRACAVDDVEHLFGISRQKVRVLEVYEGDGLSAGEEIFLTTERWSLTIRYTYDTVQLKRKGFSLTKELVDQRFISRGFINILQPEHEYLVFASGQLTDLHGSVPVYQVADGEYEEGTLFFVPIFCYDEIPNIYLSTKGNDSTYVPYAEVRDNEFFPESEEALALWLALKTEMLAAYPSDHYRF